MAKVAKVTLTVTPEESHVLHHVKVDYLLSFDDDEIGLPHQVIVELWPKELPGEEEDGLLAAWLRRPLYTFQHGPLKALQKAKTVTPTTSTVPGKAEAWLPKGTLNEDQDKSIPMPDGKEPKPLLIEDEAYARVVVRRDVSAVSQHVSFVA